MGSQALHSTLAYGWCYIHNLWTNICWKAIATKVCNPQLSNTIKVLLLGICGICLYIPHKAWSTLASTLKDSWQCHTIQVELSNLCLHFLSLICYKWYSFTEDRWPPIVHQYFIIMLFSYVQEQIVIFTPIAKVGMMWIDMVKQGIVAFPLDYIGTRKSTGYNLLRQCGSLYHLDPPGSLGFSLKKEHVNWLVWGRKKARTIREVNHMRDVRYKNPHS